MRIALGITSSLLFLIMVQCKNEYNAQDRIYYNTESGIQKVPSDIPEGAQEVYLYGNSISYLPPFSFSHLNLCRILDLSVNSINSIEERTFSGLVSLQTLKLSHNNLVTIQDYSFLGLHALNYLHLEHLNLKRIDFPTETFKDQGNLTILNFDGSQSGHSYETTLNLKPIFQHLGNLLELRISQCGIISINNGAFQGLKMLEVLTLNNNGLTILRTQAFFGLESVKTIELFGNQITTIGFDVMAALPRPLELALYDNPLICDRSLCWLRIEGEAGSVTWANEIHPVCDVTMADEDVFWNAVSWNCSNHETPVTTINYKLRHSTSRIEDGVAADSGTSPKSGDTVSDTDVVLIAATSVGTFVGGVIVTVIVVLICYKRRTTVETKSTEVTEMACDNAITARPPAPPPAPSQAPDSVYSDIYENNNTDQEHGYLEIINGGQIGQQGKLSVPDLPPGSPSVLPPTPEVAEDPRNQSAHDSGYQAEVTVYNEASD